jgi:glutathione synthase/RimK-type ligase-like ATP-grasp enzyme
MITAADLSSPGWIFDPHRPADGVAVIDGKRVPLRDISPTVTHQWITPADLPHIRVADRAYAASEMNAFLKAVLPQPPAQRNLPPLPVAGHTILLCGSPTDRALAAVHHVLEHRYASVHWESEPPTRSLRAFSAVYLRPKTASRQLRDWANNTAALVINRPSASASNSSKPYQAAFIEQFGFLTPPTLITTDADAALAFWDMHGAVIYKSISSVRSIVTRLTSAHLTRLPSLAVCPTQFQAYVPGRDIRVHLIGDRLFACQIDSDADDYRYAARTGSRLEMRNYVLPADVADRCRALVAGLGLVFAGVDLRRTPDGLWFCFEVNPSPAFTFYTASTGAPIAAAVADVLCTAAREYEGVA